MKNILYTVPLLALTLLLSLPASAVSDAQYESIRQLGQLNGVALQCRYAGETSRIKQALINRLPKRRELGVAFDEMTNQSFLDFMEQNRSCPEAGDFTRRVDRAIQTLELAF